ncbi:TIR domain-containing protein [Sabulicella rubraurantiaca]|uniref:TIR domain-containing protein n=1 Tax=Sabulicella rubraurantiaca TaxID=2811429 RepID=UPI001A96037C|nr:TIR domain-containing protein [Sabulicella rubraurantiaca]
MDQARGFLSYAHIDDEFFGGAITELRRFLELGVRVVTGEGGFQIFQDRDAIELGQKWEKRLEEGIASANLLIPVLTPSFFRSPYCRDELVMFLKHEASLGRDDLVLPLYFVTVPSLEKPELRDRDPLAKEIASRQRFDWREQAELPLTEVQVRRAARRICEAIAVALERSQAAGTAGAPPPVPPSPPATTESGAWGAVPEQTGGPGSDPFSPWPDGPDHHTTADGDEPSPPDHSPDLSLRVAGARLQGALRERSRSTERWSVLWVDDQPDKNHHEVSALREYGMRVTQVPSTEAALRELSAPGAHFDTVVSDMRRPSDQQAGFTLLAKLRSEGHGLPYFIYTGPRAPELVAGTLRRGGQGCTDRPDELVEMVLRAVGAVGPSISPAGEPQRG